VTNPSLVLTTEQECLFTALNSERVPFMIVGTSAAALLGCPLSSQGIDLWIGDAENLKRACKMAGADYSLKDGDFHIGGLGFEDFHVVWSCDGLSTFINEASSAVEMQIGDGIFVKVLPLDRVIRSKKAANRPKDRLGVMMMVDTLNCLRKIKETR
jgi:hypothetical protein